MATPHLLKSSWPVGSIAYSLALVALIDAHFRWPLSVGVMLCYVYAVREQRRRPIFVVFRRFGDPATHRALMHLAAGTAALGRTVWLLDLSQAGAIPDRSYHPFSLLAAICAVVVYAAASLVERPNAAGVLWALYVVSASFIWVAMLSGVRGTVVFNFYFAIASTLTVEPILRVAGVSAVNEWLSALLKVIVAALTYVVLWRGVNALMGWYPLLTYRCRRLFMRNMIDSTHDLAKLSAECSGRFQFWPKYLMNAPVLINDILCNAHLWQSAVTTLLTARATALAVVDVTNIVEDSGLAWEVAECESRGVPAFFISRSDKTAAAQEKLAYLRAAPTVVHSWHLRPDNPELLDEEAADILTNQFVDCVERHYPDGTVRRTR